MAFKNQGGGPWGGGGGGGGGPWGGGGPSGGGGQGPQAPDIEELLRKSQDKVKKFMPGGVGGGKGIALIGVVLVGFWLATGFYRIEPGIQGVELLFGKYVKQTGSGLKYWFPAPIGEVIKVNVEQTNEIQIGYRGATAAGARSTGRRDVAEESLMLTSDQNIVDIDFVVQWRINSAADYLFNIRDPQATIKIAAESAIREVVGRTPLDLALTTRREAIDTETGQLLQEILNEYGAGVTVASVKLQEVDPPSQVIDAFNDVQRARQDQERVINEATRYQNEIVPRAKGEAEKLLNEAEAYKEQVTNAAKGEAQRFVDVYNAYLGNTEVTRRRLYLERMQDVLGRVDKVILDEGPGGSSQGVVPYLPLNELTRRSGGSN